MMLTLEAVKKYLRIDFKDDDDYIYDLINLSKSYIYQQTNVHYNCNDAVYNQAVLFMVAHFYDNRSPISEKAITEVPMTLTSMIKHIGMRGEYEQR